MRQLRAKVYLQLQHQCHLLHSFAAAIAVSSATFICCCNSGVTWSAEFSLRVYRMPRSASTAISRMGLGLAKKLDQKEGYRELHPLLASLCACVPQILSSTSVYAHLRHGPIGHRYSQ